MISRKRLKKESRKNEVEELYLAMIREISDDEDAQASAPEWIQKEYGEIFREGLPPGMSFTRTVDPEMASGRVNSRFRLVSIPIFSGATPDC